MTDRLYYTDSYLREFHARTVSIGVRDGHPVAILDRTAFYPTSGGQPFDTGTLNAVRVLDVIDEDGGLVHVLDGPLPEDAAVHGIIDWERRFDHMQQHTGQHVLSAAFDRLLGARTMSFHLGKETVTIDLAVELQEEALERAETEANRVVWENRPVKISFAGPSEAAELGFRKEPVRTGELRVIDVGGFDLSACGGTHVANTGSIGLIAIVGSERFRGGSRVEFVCGGRALGSHRALRRASAHSIRLLSVLPGDVPGAIERLQAENKDARHQLKDLVRNLAVYEAQALIAQAPLAGTVRLVTQAIAGADVARLKDLAAALADNSSTAAVLVSRDAPHLVVVARSKDVGVDAAAVLRDLLARFGGRGGGRPELAQAGGLTGPLDDLLDAARLALSRGAGG